MINFYNFVFYNFLEIEEVKGEIKKKVIGCFYVKLIVCIYKYQNFNYLSMDYKEKCNNYVYFIIYYICNSN